MRTVRAGRFVLSALSLSAIATFAVVASLRLRYPFELDWLESGVLDHVRRLSDGQSIYVAPTVDFVSFPYPPVYPLVGGLFATVFGVDFFALRLVSVLATVATFIVLYRIVERETHSRWAGLLAAGVYAACYSYVGGWFDVGKADSLFLLFTLCAVYVARDAVAAKTNCIRRAAIAGLVFALAILTKQTALLVFIPVAAYLVVTRPKVGCVVAGICATTVGLVTIVMNVITEGWFGYFIWRQLQEHNSTDIPAIEFVTRDMKPFLPVLLLALIIGKRWWSSNRRWSTGLYGAAVIGMVAGSWLSRMHEGGFVNVLMPACAAAALVLGLSADWFNTKTTSALVQLGSIALCAAVFVSLAYNPKDHLPTKANHEAGQQLVREIRGIPGEVLVANHPTYGVMAGKELYGHSGGAIDVTRAKNEKAKAALRDSYFDAISERRFAAVILDDGSELFLLDELERCYILSTKDIFTGAPLVPLEGFPTYPRQIWLARANGCT